MLLFPVMCTMRKRGMALQARELFRSKIVQKFEEFFGDEGKTTFFRSLYKPTDILYGLTGGYWCNATVEVWQEMVDWALESGTGTFSPHMESAAQGIGRDGKGTIAEICLLLVEGSERF